jgi:hypothetical protein
MLSELLERAGRGGEVGALLVASFDRPAATT